MPSRPPPPPIPKSRLTGCCGWLQGNITLRDNSFQRDTSRNGSDLVIISSRARVRPDGASGASLEAALGASVCFEPATPHFLAAMVVHDAVLETCGADLGTRATVYAQMLRIVRYYAHRCPVPSASGSAVTDDWCRDVGGEGESEIHALHILGGDLQWLDGSVMLSADARSVGWCARADVPPGHMASVAMVCHSQACRPLHRQVLESTGEAYLSSTAELGVSRTMPGATQPRLVFSNGDPSSERRPVLRLPASGFESDADLVLTHRTVMVRRLPESQRPGLSRLPTSLPGAASCPHAGRCRRP